MPTTPESTQVFMHDPASQKLRNIMEFAAKEVHGHADVMSPDVALTVLGAAVNLMTFYGHSPQSIAQIAEGMHKAAINTFGPSGNEAYCDKIYAATKGH